MNQKESEAPWISDHHCKRETVAYNEYCEVALVQRTLKAVTRQAENLVWVDLSWAVSDQGKKALNMLGIPLAYYEEDYFSKITPTKGVWYLESEWATVKQEWLKKTEGQKRPKTLPKSTISTLGQVLAFEGKPNEIRSLRAFDNVLPTSTEVQSQKGEKQFFLIENIFKNLERMHHNAMPKEELKEIQTQTEQAIETLNNAVNKGTLALIGYDSDAWLKGWDFKKGGGTTVQEQPALVGRVQCNASSQERLKEFLQLIDPLWEKEIVLEVLVQDLFGNVTPEGLELCAKPNAQECANVLEWIAAQTKGNAGKKPEREFRSPELAITLQAMPEKQYRALKNKAMQEYAKLEEVLRVCMREEFEERGLQEERREHNRWTNRISPLIGLNPEGIKDWLKLLCEFSPQWFSPSVDQSLFEEPVLSMKVYQRMESVLALQEQKQTTEQTRARRVKL